MYSKNLQNKTLATLQQFRLN